MEAIQLQCPNNPGSCNFAGSFIRANKPIAVFASSSSTNSYQVEQLTPLHALGKRFSLVGSSYLHGEPSCASCFFKELTLHILDVVGDFKVMWCR